MSRGCIDSQAARFPARAAAAGHALPRPPGSAGRPCISWQHGGEAGERLWRRDGQRRARCDRRPGYRQAGGIVRQALYRKYRIIGEVHNWPDLGTAGGRGYWGRRVPAVRRVAGWLPAPPRVRAAGAPARCAAGAARRACALPASWAGMCVRGASGPRPVEQARPLAGAFALALCYDGASPGLRWGDGPRAAPRGPPAACPVAHRPAAAVRRGREEAARAGAPAFPALVGVGPPDNARRRHARPAPRLPRR